MMLHMFEICEVRSSFLKSDNNDNKHKNDENTLS